MQLLAFGNFKCKAFCFFLFSPVCLTTGYKKSSGGCSGVCLIQEVVYCLISTIYPSIAGRDSLFICLFVSELYHFFWLYQFFGAVCLHSSCFQTLLPCYFFMTYNTENSHVFKYQILKIFSLLTILCSLNRHSVFVLTMSQVFFFF